MYVDIQDLLSDQDIRYATRGKNIGSGWTGVDCPHCDDTRNHCGINPDGTGYSCFVCGGKGGIAKFIKLTLKISFQEANQIIQNYADKFYFDPKTPERKVPSIELPGTEEMPPLHRKYLLTRGYDPDHIRDNYGVRCEYQTGDFKYRLIIPVYFNSKVVNFVGRDVTGKQDLRYKYPLDSKCPLSIGHVIYNWDSIHKRAILVEGIFDQWRIGEDCAAVLGTVVTDAQIRILSKLDEAWILFDRSKEATKKAKHLLGILSFCGVKGGRLNLPSNAEDPDQLSFEQVIDIKRKLNFL